MLCPAYYEVWTPGRLHFIRLHDNYNYDVVWTPGRSHCMRLHNNYNLSVQLFEILL